jgi:transcriptional regulator with XRE-family HTH domain
MSKYSIHKLPHDILQMTAVKVKALRKQAGYSQKELAERSGVSHGSIKRFEQTGQIAFLSLLKLCHVLDRLSDFEPILHPKPAKDLNQLFAE